MISILCPTRGRPRQFFKMAGSAFATATYQERIEVVAAVDDDDETRDELPSSDRFVIRYLTVARSTHSDYWNVCAADARGDILMLCGDDVRFRTPNWDTVVEREFDRWPDRIVLVHGDDGGNHPQTVGTHPFLHRRWVETVGYFTPPGFVSDFTDTWLDELAVGVGRKVKVPIVTEHLHPLWGKGDLDETHRERLARHAVQDPAAVYEQRAPERAEAIRRLMAAMT